MVGPRYRSMVGGNADLTRDKRTLLPSVIRASNYLLRLTPFGDMLDDMVLLVDVAPNDRRDGLALRKINDRV
ncbi:hypothetical protein M0804_011925 [Polistes exclamans]|nr:hypothetical protein M0804_011925 [Polistes exclamans]